MDRKQFIKKFVVGDYRTVFTLAVLIFLVIGVFSINIQIDLGDGISLLKLVGLIVAFFVVVGLLSLVLQFLLKQVSKLLPGSFISSLRKNSVWIDLFLCLLVIAFFWYQVYPKNSLFCIAWSVYIIARITLRVIKHVQKPQL